jgi:tRNA(fMet)-specific endonuclease VapC
MYLLDTNILSELIKKRPNPRLFSQLSSMPSIALFTSSICVMELRFGSSRRDDSKEFWQKIDEQIISRVNVIPLGEKEALAAGDILADLRKAGRTTGIEDVLIAASAVTHQCVLVTANTRHFSEIRGLIVENWLKKV